jgi:hypothetical protein
VNRGSIRVVCLILLVPASGCTSVNSAENGKTAEADGGDMNTTDRGLAGASGDAAQAGVGGSSHRRMPDRSVPADGWRWESSLGVEVAVPADWATNDTDCGQTEASSVVRSQGLVSNCFTPEPPTKQIVEIADEHTAKDVSRPAGLVYSEVAIGTAAAERGEGETADGRAAGWLHISSVGVIVDVRVRDVRTLKMILDSVRVVDTDHNLCATSLKDMSPEAPKADTLTPSHASAVSVCYFDKKSVLQASTLIEGSEAEKLVAALNAARPGRNIDPPETTCLREKEMPPPDAVLLVHGEDDYAQVKMTFSTCLHRGLSNGRSEAELTMTVMEAAMGPLSVSYHYLPLPN